MSSMLLTLFRCHLHLRLQHLVANDQVRSTDAGTEENHENRRQLVFVVNGERQVLWTCKTHGGEWICGGYAPYVINVWVLLNINAVHTAPGTPPSPLKRTDRCITLRDASFTIWLNIFQRDCGRIYCFKLQRLDFFSGRWMWWSCCCWFGLMWQEEKGHPHDEFCQNVFTRR